MTEEKGSTASTWAKAAGVHLAVVALCFALSLMLLRRVGLLPGEVLEFMAVCFFLFYATAAVVATLIRKASVLSCIVVFAIAFAPGGCLGIGEIHKEINHRYYLPYDRFRDNLLSPVPKSVSNLRFVPPEEGISFNLMFQFDIDPADLEAILTNLNTKRVERANMRNPKDFFQHSFYMPIEGDYHLFQGANKYDDVLTLKTNESHTHAIFRKERSDFYRERMWENGNQTIIQMDNEALEQLRRKYGK